MLEKGALLDENIFLSEIVSQLFAELQLDTLYIGELDILFAVTTIQLPTNDYPYLRFSGFNINDVRINKEQTQQMKVKLRKRMERPYLEFIFKSENWILIKDKLALDNLNKKKF